MKKRIHPVVVVMAVVVVLVAIAMVYSRRLQEPAPIATAGSGPEMSGRMRGRMGGRGGGEGGTPGGGGSSRSAGLGVQFTPSQEPRGFRVVAFEGPPSSSPLQIVGVQAGDVITECNGASSQIRDALVRCIKELQEQGHPINLKVDRKGNQVTLTRAEKLPAESVKAVMGAPAGEGMGRGPARSRSGPGGTPAGSRRGR